MFLIDKYKPKKFNDSLINKSVIKDLKLFTNDNEIYNMVIHGPDGCGKYTLANMVLENIYGPSVLNIKFNEISLDNNKTCNILASPFHYVININEYSFNDKTSLITLLNNLCSSININTLKYNIFIIRNIQFLKKEVIDAFNTYTNQNCLYSRFILIGNSISHISNKLTNFAYFKVPYEKKENIINYINTFDETKNLDMKILDKILNKNFYNNHYNISKILYSIEYYLFSNNTELYYNSKILDIIKYMKTKKVSNIVKIRNILYDLCSKNYNKRNIIKHILLNTIKLDITDNAKINITKIASSIDYQMSNSYRNYIHLESFIVRVMNEL
jgi:replication factor C subunit 3/5